MRDIEFRGIGVNGWIHGSFIANGMAIDNMLHAASIAPIGCYPAGVNPETVGQFTGLRDKNGVKIFEGDILGRDNVEPREVIFEDGAFRFMDETSSQCNQALVPFTASKLNVLGNIYQNPELINQ